MTPQDRTRATCVDDCEEWPGSNAFDGQLISRLVDGRRAEAAAIGVESLDGNSTGDFHSRLIGVKKESAAST